MAAEVYGDLGDYGRVLPAWLAQPGILSYVEENALGQLRGFMLLGFYQPDDRVRGWIADLLAIGVAPEHQRQGVGRAMLSYAICVARAVGREHAVREIRLTVADDNVVGQHLYASAGFRVLEEDHGTYAGGQRAIRMGRGL